MERLFMHGEVLKGGVKMETKQKFCKIHFNSIHISYPRKSA